MATRLQRAAATALRKFRRFNRSDPRKIRNVSIDTDTPLVRIGPVPVITYISSKEGKLRAYKHTTKRPHPVLYAHPSGKFFLIIGGRTRIDDWLYD